MRRKLLTWLLAISVTAGTLMSPMQAFAAEVSELNPQVVSAVVSEADDEASLTGSTTQDGAEDSIEGSEILEGAEDGNDSIEGSEAQEEADGAEDKNDGEEGSEPWEGADSENGSDEAGDETDDDETGDDEEAAGDETIAEDETELEEEIVEETDEELLSETEAEEETNLLGEADKELPEDGFIPATAAKRYSEPFSVSKDDDSFAQVYTWSGHVALYIWGTSTKNNYINPEDYTVKSCFPAIHADDYKNVTDLVIDPNISLIGELAFKDFTALQAVHFEGTSTLTEIGQSAFIDCSALTDFTVPKSMEAFVAHDGTVLDTSNIFAGCTSLKTLNFEEGITHIPTCIAQFRAVPSYIETVNIPSSVTVIEEYAFRDCSSLINVNFGAGCVLTKIGAGAFQNCDLPSIELPAFKNGVIEEAAFWANPKLKTLAFPEGIIEISSNVFTGGDDVNLREVYLPKSLKKIYQFSENRHYKKLEAIYYPGTKTQFRSIEGVRKTEISDADLEQYSEEYPDYWWNFMVFEAESVSSITLSETDVVCYVDDIEAGLSTLTIEATLLPAKHIDAEIKAKSSNESIVSIKEISQEDKTTGKGAVVLKLHETVGEATVTVSAGTASAGVNVKIKEKDKAETPYFYYPDGFTEGARLNILSGTKDAQIFYRIDATEPFPAWIDNCVKWNEETNRYESNKAGVFEYSDALIIGQDVTVLKGVVSAVSIKPGLALSDSDFVKVDLIDYNRWGTITEEDKMDEFDGDYSKFNVEEYQGLWIPKSQLLYSGLVYNGKAQTIPDLRVYFGNRLLTFKTDYTTKYSNNINASGMARLQVTLKGSYAGSKTFEFAILKRSVNMTDFISGLATFTPVNLNAKKSGDTYVTQYPNPKVTVDGRTLKVDTDVKYEYKTSGETIFHDGVSTPGIYVLAVEDGAGANYDFSEVEIMNAVHVISAEDVPASKLTVSKIPAQDISKHPCPGGYSVNPDFTVSYKGKELTYGSDKHYTYFFEDNEKAGTGKLLICGTGVAYDGITVKGIKTVTFKINPIKLTAADVTITGLADSYTYTGSAILPGTTVKRGETTLEKGKDYTVAGKNNINKGTATYTYTFMGAYSGKVTKTAKILPADIAAAQTNEIFDDYSYQKAGVKPVTELTYAGKTLNGKKDYAIAYTGNNAVGDAKATITGKGNFQGTKTVNFKVSSGYTSDLTINLTDQVASTKANKFTQKFTITENRTGTKLVAGTDYEKTAVYTYDEDTIVKVKSGKNTISVLREKGIEVTKDDIIPAGAVIRVTVKNLNANYYGKIVGKYCFAQKAAKTLKFSVDEQSYTGSAITPGKSAIHIKGMSDADAARCYEIVGYSNNIKKGTGKITVRGLGDYAGTVTATFKIVARK